MYKRKIAVLRATVKIDDDNLQTSIEIKNRLQETIYQQFQQLQLSKSKLKEAESEQRWYDYLNPKWFWEKWL